MAMQARDRDPDPGRQERARALLAAAERTQPRTTAFLEELARLETPSVEPETQGPALDLIAAAAAEAGMRCRRYRGRTSGGTLIARWPAPARTPIQLLIGHCDTVWPVGTLATMPVKTEGPILSGPGVFDMKAGVTQMLVALRLLREHDLEPAVRPVMLVNSDEEIGTRDTFRTITRLARLADRAYVLEPSLAPNGALKTARKGVSQYRVRVHGRAAHAGLNPEEGISAIVELSYVVQKIHALNDPASGVTVNVGTIDGGMRPNVVAPVSTAYVDVRVPTHADLERVDAALRGLEPTRPDVKIEVSCEEGRAPMEYGPGGQRLWAAAERAAAAMGFSLTHGLAGGGSDGNITSQYTPTLDGLGAVGDGAHSAHEHVDLRHMPQRIALLAELLLLPALGRRQGRDHE